MSDVLLPPPNAPALPASNYDAIAAWFFGPHAENSKYLQAFIDRALEKHKYFRAAMYATDPRSITEKMQSSGLFKTNMKAREAEHEAVMGLLGKNSVPFWSPRYNAHMLMDTTLASNVGCAYHHHPSGRVFTLSNVV